MRIKVFVAKLFPLSKTASLRDQNTSFAQGKAICSMKLGSGSGTEAMFTSWAPMVDDSASLL